MLYGHRQFQCVSKTNYFDEDIPEDVETRFDTFKDLKRVIRSNSARKTTFS